MLTKRQKQIMDFMSEYRKKNGYSPSLEEIGHHFKLSSVGTVHEHLSKLQKKGYLKRGAQTSRSLSPYNPVKEGVTEIPLMGTISAGGPIEAIKNPEPLEVPKSMLSRGGRHYALKISGTSMIEEGISDGDIVIVREQPTVENGEKVVAYLPDKDAVTLKKIYREKNRVKLVPANKTMEPFYEKNVEIQGKVVGVMRKET